VISGQGRVAVTLAVRCLDDPLSNWPGSPCLEDYHNIALADSNTTGAAKKGKSYDLNFSLSLLRKPFFLPESLPLVFCESGVPFSLSIIELRLLLGVPGAFLRGVPTGVFDEATAPVSVPVVTVG